jgi:hypothetical protein
MMQKPTPEYFDDCCNEFWFVSTYRNDSYPNMWDTLEECHALFREASHFVADSLGYCYPDYDEKVSGYILPGSKKNANKR